MNATIKSTPAETVIRFANGAAVYFDGRTVKAFAAGGACLHSPAQRGAADFAQCLTLAIAAPTHTED